MAVADELVDIFEDRRERAADDEEEDGEGNDAGQQAQT